MLNKTKLTIVFFVALIMVLLSVGLQTGNTEAYEGPSLSAYSLLEQDISFNQKYDFSNITLEDFESDFIIAVNDWIFEEDGLSPSSNGESRVFLVNPREEYVVRGTVELGQSDRNPPRGGYGIMFETYLDDNNRDTGFILQFDRGFANGELIIRHRSPRYGGDAQESSAPVFRFNDRDKIPSRHDEPEWWSKEHVIELQVKSIKGTEPGKKVLKVNIDGKHMFDWEFKTEIVDPSLNHTGLRTWHEGSNTIFKALMVQGERELHIPHKGEDVSVHNTPPGVTKALDPGISSSPGSYINNLTPTMHWTHEPRANYYALAISKYPYGTENIIYNPQRLTGTSHTVSPGVLIPGVRYRWNLQAGNNAGWGPISNTLYFQIDETNIQVSINNRLLSLDVPPVIQQGRTLVPFRAIGEALGAAVNWDSQTQKVTLSLEETTVILRIAENTAYVNGQPVSLDVPARIKEGRTMVPLRFISEALGASVTWDEATRWVDIISGPIKTVPDPSEEIRWSLPIKNPDVIFGYNIYSSSANGYHTGIDVRDVDINKQNVAVYAIANGVVAEVFTAEPITTPPYWSGGKGAHGDNWNMQNIIIIEHTLPNMQKIYSLYAHLSKVMVQQGEVVTGGKTLIGETGVNLRCGRYVRHVHLEMKTKPVAGDPLSNGTAHWGYTPNSPDIYGYKNPMGFISN